MAKTWTEIANDPEFQQLSPEDQAAIKEHYADNMANDPEFGQLSPEDQAAVRAQFLNPAPLDPDVARQIVPSPPRVTMKPGVVPPSTTPIPQWGEGKFLPTPFVGQVPAEEQPKERDLMGALQEGAGNFPMSWRKHLGEAIHSITHPWELLPLLQALGEVNPGNIAMRGGVNNENLKPLEAIGEDYKEHYGSGQKILNTIATDPVRLTTDALTVAAPLLGPTNSAIKALQLANPKVGGIVKGATTAASVAANPALITEPVVQAGGKAVRGAANIPDPTSNVIDNALVSKKLGDRRPEAVNALRENNVIVEGSNPNVGEVLAGRDIVATKLQAIQKKGNELLSDEATIAKEQKNAARLAEVQKVGKTPAELEAAIKELDDISAKNYADAGVVRDPNKPSAYPVADIRLNADPELVSLFQSIPMQKALRVASENRRPIESPVKSVRGTETSAPAVPTDDMGQVRMQPRSGEDIYLNNPERPMGPQGTATSRATTHEYMPQSANDGISRQLSYHPNDIHRLKLALDELAYGSDSTKALHGINAANLGDVLAVRNQLIGWMEKHNPAYKNARETHHERSKTIDQMKIGQFLEDKLKNPTLGDDTSTLLADSFSRAIKEAVTANSNIKRATGQQRYRNLDDVLTPEQMASLEKVQADLARAKKAEAHARDGSKHGKEMEEAASPAPQLPNALQATVTLANAALRGMTGRVNKKVANKLAEAMQDPKEMADLIQKAIEREAKLERFSRHARTVGRAGQKLNRAPGVYNALAAEREDRERRNALAP